MPQLWKALPTVNWTYSRSQFHVAAVNSNFFTTQPVTLVGVVFGLGGQIEAIGSTKIHELGPSSTDNVNVRVRIGRASGEQTTSLFEDD
jgi:hypothetical protein